ncbi:hypothetical protein Bca101_070328 [Brassica carinata]
MSLSMRNELTLFGRTTGLFTADMKLHLHKLRLSSTKCLGPGPILSSLFRHVRKSLITLKIFTLSLGQGQEASSLYVQYKVSTVTYSDSLLITANYETSATRCQFRMSKSEFQNFSGWVCLVAHICGDCYLELGLKLLLRDVKRNRWYKATNIQAPAGKIQRLLVLVSSAGMERSKINPTKTDGIKISVEMIQASKRPWQVYGHTRHSQAYSNVQALRC